MQSRFKLVDQYILNMRQCFDPYFELVQKPPSHLSPIFDFIMVILNSENFPID